MTDQAARIADAIMARAPFDDLGASAPQSLVEAYALQAQVVERLAAAHGGIGGRKIAWNTAAQMDAMGLSEPGAACICADLVRRSPATLSASDFHTFAIEPEICAILKADLAPREHGHDRASVIEAVERLAPAFELLDTRGMAKAAPFSILAQNINNRGIVIGGPGLAPHDVDPSALRSVVTCNGEVMLDKAGAAPMDPLTSVAFLANRFNALGITPKAGEVLLLGAHLPPTPIPAPATMRFELGAMGAVEFTIA
ncbi:hypothetical protein P2H44_05760 [Albimonas sp. CAU 1670]|uniref:2-keto-4-pentenoate hydratase n=1 Tax=Albimonas sp. CAU 1670 TaxID=3032599 RepID=UPI0023DAC1D9|nr:hypothetical protein [Albimonas sp. CAU 1670]MDF2232053.1 hypothetical protein [Albimonas sp. CAU 1670]